MPKASSVVYVRRIMSVAIVLLVMASCTAVAPVSPSLLPSTAHVGPTSSATPPATPRPSETVVAGADPLPAAGEIEPGRYFIEKGPWTPTTFAFTLPAGWFAQNGGQTISKHPDESGREVSWSVSIVERLFKDPCGANATIDVGPSADDLVDALLALPGSQAEEPFFFAVGRRPGKRIDLTVPADVDLDACDPPIGLQIWLDKNAGKYLVIGPEATSRVYSVDADHGRFVVVASVNKTAADADIAEMDTIMDSIRFHR